MRGLLHLRKEAIMQISSQLLLLIVDDEPSIRNGLAQALPFSEMNIKVAGLAGSGNEALDMIRLQTPDIVLTDIKMPNGNGLDLIKSAKKLGLHSRFIIMSGYDDFQFAKTALQYGVEDYLLKPIKKEELIQALLKVRDKAEAERRSVRLLQSKESFLRNLMHRSYDRSQPLPEFLLEYSNRLPLCILVCDGDFYPQELKKELASLIPDSTGIVFECDEHRLAVLLSLQVFSQTVPLALKEFCQNVVTRVSALFHTPVYIGIGNSVSNISLLRHSYRSALEYLSYSMYKTELQVFDSALLETGDSCPVTINNSYSDRLLEAILNYQPEHIDEITRSFLDWILYIPMPPPSFVRGMCTHLMVDIQKNLSSYKILRNEFLINTPHKAIAQCLFLSDISQWMISALRHYATVLHVHVIDDNAPVIEAAASYIRKNITSRLTLEEVASQVHLSKNYFAALFKDYMGINFRDYVLEKKIDYAKKLLKETDITVSNLSSLLGYEEYRSFNRAFKKSTGKSPSDYHRLYNPSFASDSKRDE